MLGKSFLQLSSYMERKKELTRRARRACRFTIKICFCVGSYHTHIWNRALRNTEPRGKKNVVRLVEYQRGEVLLGFVSIWCCEKGVPRLTYRSRRMFRQNDCKGYVMRERKHKCVESTSVCCVIRGSFVRAQEQESERRGLFKMFVFGVNKSDNG